MELQTLIQQQIVFANRAEIPAIGILTSGGDAGGLNAVIKSAVGLATRLGIKVYAIPRGYAGLYNLVDFDSLTELTFDRADLIDVFDAGAETGNSRVSIKKISDPDKFKRIKAGLEKFNIKALIISGGDDTGSIMVLLVEQGIQVIHVPKTMDLDLQSNSVGGDSTINRIAEMIHDLKTTGNTHNRIIPLEAFGRYAGHSAYHGGIAGGADCILLPEIPVDFEIVYQHAKERFWNRVRRSDVQAGTYIIVVAEGVKNLAGELVTDGTTRDSFDHAVLGGVGKFVAKQIERRLKEDPDTKDLMKEQHLFVEGVYEVPECKESTPKHLVRCGRSYALDVNFGTQVGACAVLLLANGINGFSVVQAKDGEIQVMDTKQLIKQRYCDLNQVALYEAQGYCFGRKPEPPRFMVRQLAEDCLINRPY